MGKKGKNSRVKGYGVYWSGDIKNKHIARKNKQYIRDQKYLHRYKKLKESMEEGDNSQQLDIHTHSSERNHEDFAPVGLIRPEVETTYLSQSDDEPVEDSPAPHDPGDEPPDENETPRAENRGEKGDVYSKVLKKRRELERQRQEEYDQRVEEIKRRKKEIRQKKQKRYERHRLLGVKTKKGQPIMKNVIKHIMRDFKPD